ncbi:MAG: hypothetical protein M3R14_10590 [Acidobacteriota bacterium]|nr:hypothetical protein [Acidobacteriota bacterium]
MSYAPLFGFAVIAAKFVNTLLTGLIGSAALIYGLAFGLAGAMSPRKLRRNGIRQSNYG